MYIQLAKDINRGIINKDIIFHRKITEILSFNDNIPDYLSLNFKYFTKNKCVNNLIIKAVQSLEKSNYLLAQAYYNKYLSILNKTTDDITEIYKLLSDTRILERAISDDYDSELVKLRQLINKESSDYTKLTSDIRLYNTNLKANADLGKRKSYLTEIVNRITKLYKECLSKSNISNRLYISFSETTPLIDFDINANRFNIEGASYPINSKYFWDRVIDWLTLSIIDKKIDKLHLRIKLSYTNESTIRMMYYLLNLLETIPESSIEWIYEEGDEIMLGNIERLTSVINTPILAREVGEIEFIK